MPALLKPAERQFLTALSDLTHCNPFKSRRIELERVALGADYVAEDVSAWSMNADGDRTERPNVGRLTERANQVVEQLFQRLTDGTSSRATISPEEAHLYDDLTTYVLYYRHVACLPYETVARHQLKSSDKQTVARAWRAFRDDRLRLLVALKRDDDGLTTESSHLFACLYQVRRAFSHIFHCLIGESGPATRLRAQVWESIFTHDLRRYRRTLYDRMADLSTLVTGPSGSGKELVAMAIGLSQFQAFDADAESFESAAQGNGEAFLPLNLSALSPTLIESELFGHRKGSFTGATSDRTGWLGLCPSYGAVFLDEIGELDPAIQVKLLRVVQSREYAPLGDSRPQTFAGKLIAATNRDMAEEMRAGRFREDLYYRLCSDRIVAPALSDHINDTPEAIAGLVQYLARRVIGVEDKSAANDEASYLAGEVMGWIERELPRDYAWPGNIRELEQCVRNVLVRQEYHPASEQSALAREAWLDLAAAGELSADELLTHYCKRVHQQQGGYEQAARVLGLDRRTVKARVQQAIDG